MVKHCRNAIEFSVHSHFGQNFTVEFVPVLQKKLGWPTCTQSDPETVAITHYLFGAVCKDFGSIWRLQIYCILDVKTSGISGHKYLERQRALIFCNLYSSDTLPANEKHFFPNSEAAYKTKFSKGRTECPVTFESPTFFVLKSVFFSSRAPNFYCAKEWQSWKKVFTKQINAVFGVFSKTLNIQASLNNSQI